MYEFHGWATIRETPSDIDEEILDEIVDKIRSFIRNLNWSSGVLEIQGINGEYHLMVSGLTNHKGQEAEDVFCLYKYIADIAPGSYGLLYIRDDEDIKGNDNKFQVLVLARGKLCKHEDPFLSPNIPVIEDEFGD